MKKLFYLFLGIIGISSCTNDNFIEQQAENTTSEIVHKKLTYEQASKAINNEPAFDEKLKNSFHDNFNLLSNNLNKTTNSTEESTEILIDYFFDPVHDNETYSFITHEFTGTVEDDYLEKFVLTVEEGEQKVGYLRYYPTTDFSTEYFNGKIETSNLDRSQIEESYIENGVTIQNKSNGNQTYGITKDCETTIVIGSTVCSNGGKHRYGVPCTGKGAVNDAYLYVSSYTTCVTTITSDILPMPVFIMDLNPNRGGGGGGSNNSQTQQNSFMNSLPDTAKQYLNDRPELKHVVMMYLANKKYSYESTNIATHLSIFIANDTVLKNNDLLAELIVKQILFSNKYTLDEFFSFWNNLTPAEKAIFDNYANNGISANGNFLKPSVQTFLSWAFPYLIDNPTVTVDQFENWFIDGGDMSSNMISEFLADIENPNLIIPTRRFKNNVRLNAIYNKAKQAANIKQYLENFDSQFSVAHLILDAKPFTDSSDANARTYEPEHYRIEIVFNQNNLNRPWLDIARTMMHEVVHAEMYRILLSLASTNGQIDKVDLKNKLTNHNYPGLYEYYRIYGFQNMQHEQMADHYRGIIRAFLMQLDNTITYAQADAMAWVGLQGTTAWNNLTTAQKNNIINTYNSWYNNAPINLP